MRTPVPGADPKVEKAANGKAYYKNLILCSRVWECPFCSIRIGNERREELSQALIKARKLGLTPVLCTFTLQHHQTDACADNIAALQAAYRSCFSGRFMGILREQYNWVGSIRNLECTVGLNGWHTHSHALVFLDLSALESSAETVAGSLKLKLAEQWQNALKKQGYNATLERGVDVRTADAEIAEYVTKFGREPANWWGAADEMARTPSKKAAHDGLTPMGLLEACTVKDKIVFLQRFGSVLRSQRQAAAMFKEYAAAFKSRHQLQWSRGLRDLLAMGEETPDDEIEVVEEQTPEPVMSIPVDVWKWVCRQELRFEVLESAAGGCAALLAWFETHGIRITIYDLDAIARGAK